MTNLSEADILALLDRPVTLQVKELTGITESKDAYYLGNLGVHKYTPRFRAAYWFGLSDTSRFRVLPIHLPQADLDGVAVIFHQFDRTPDEEDSFEIFLGWVPRAHQEQCDEWVTFLNQEISNRLAGK